MITLICNEDESYTVGIGDHSTGPLYNAVDIIIRLIAFLYRETNERLDDNSRVVYNQLVYTHMHNSYKNAYH
jgi:hypothetical protein